jgi:predicted nuclease of predicted toxin-antitoxin system
LRFLADMGISHRVVEWLRHNKYDAIHLWEEGLQKLPDGDIFSKALNEQRIILTFDLDFGEIVALSKGQKPGVILFRLHNTRASHVIERLEAVLRDCPASIFDSVTIVEETRFRIRQFPK